jgi:hypothetical protein
VDDRRRINTTEMVALRRSARISELDRKTNEYIRGKMDAQDMILDDITRKLLIWYGHVERMDPTRLPKIVIHWKPEGRKKRGRPRRTWKDGIYTAMNERAMEYKSREASSDVLKPRNVCVHIYIHLVLCKICKYNY